MAEKTFTFKEIVNVLFVLAEDDVKSHTYPTSNYFSSSHKLKICDIIKKFGELVEGSNKEYDKTK